MELSTRLYKLDFQELIDNSTNRRYWDKQWEIYNYGEISIVFRLERIDIINNKMYGEIRLKDNRKTSGISRDIIARIVIPLQKANYNKSALEKELCGKINNLFLELGVREIKKSEEYCQLLLAESDFADRLKDIAESFLDDNDVSNHAIRDVYIDSYVSANEKDYTYEYLNENKYSKFVEHRATFYYVMGLNEKAKDIIKESDEVDFEHILEEAKKLMEQLEDDDMEEFEEKLEDI